MCKELEKWHPPHPPARRDERRELQLVEKTIARWKAAHTALPVPHTPRRVSAPAAAGASIMWAPPPHTPLAKEPIMDLPRVCAITGLLWTARYERKHGDSHYRYLRSTVAESYQCVTHYGPENWRTIPNVFLGIEVCPQCGGFTNNGSVGAVWCPGCRQNVCFGHTSRSGYFVCCCGFHGQLVNGQIPANGYR